MFLLENVFNVPQNESEPPFSKNTLFHRRVRQYFELSFPSQHWLEREKELVLVFHSHCLFNTANLSSVSTGTYNINTSKFAPFSLSPLLLSLLLLYFSQLDTLIYFNGFPGCKSVHLQSSHHACQCSFQDRNSPWWYQDNKNGQPWRCQAQRVIHFMISDAHSI